MNRREFLSVAGAGAAFTITNRHLRGDMPASRPSLPDPSPSKLPRWRGFNLLAKYEAQDSQAFSEKDFALIAEWGMDFARLPLSYRCWSNPDHWMEIREQAFRDIDQAIEFGRQYQIHVNLNLHRAPGWCVNAPPEPVSLWTDDKALDACAFHWTYLAKRYKDIPSTQLSFNLLNEPKHITEEPYVRVIKRLAEAIRAVDPHRLIMADGLQWGYIPVLSLAGLNIAESTHGYWPMPLTHYQASWVEESVKWAEPTWPLTLIQKEADGSETREVCDKQRLVQEYITPWQKLQNEHVGIHVGEFGCHNRTPHGVVLAWMKDVLDLWKEQGWGWALWNLGGSFGVIDSGRRDIVYENFRGRKLDRKMLELLRAS